ncbi:MAG: hypothetical protein ACFFBP_08225 [Promethearchaeota archaeon]
MALELFIGTIVELSAQLALYLVKSRKKNYKKIFDEFIIPIFSEFEKIHEEYIRHFNEYRALIQSSNKLIEIDMKTILDRIYYDNLVTMHHRTKVFELSKYAKEDKYGSFIYSICRYLADPELFDPETRELFNPEGIEELPLRQYWRHSLSERISDIRDEYWNSVVDPACSKPPMSPKQIELQLEQWFEKFNIDQNDSEKIEKLKIALSLEELDQIVAEMQSGYQDVYSEYLKLKELKKTKIKLTKTV